MKSTRLCAVVYALGLTLSHTHAVGFAHAQTDERASSEDVSADIKAVKACVNSLGRQKKGRSANEKSHDDQYDCIGVIMRPCIDEPSDESSSDHSLMCAEREFQAWDAVLNENYQKKLEQIQSGDDDDEDVKRRQVETLRAAQRLWVQFRDAEVERMDAESYGAGGHWIAYNDEFVKMDLTAKRAIDLK
ncbi:lysozyme inhibitor LprI family protein [Aureimonas ureilytica]|uniref:lysozyme inhibitor LprI family protein n=1 Tax=Aureimonas ureilytica TaxID=401562 RepID=UPI00073427C5|nr:lysozyme inhibitor LprI family protein [Aureimonas ureilytica]